VDPVGSGYGLVAGCCEYGDEPSGSCTTELVSCTVTVGLDFLIPSQIYVEYSDSLFNIN
jgi:hypothetical protein